MASKTSTAKSRSSRSRKEQDNTPVVDETPVVTEVATATEEAKVEEPKETAADRKRKKEMEFIIPDERLDFVVRNARPAMNNCLCGCGSVTKGRFFPGHDATLKRELSATVAHGTDEAKALAAEALDKFGWA